jgi:hypothetical protein
MALATACHWLGWLIRELAWRNAFVLVGLPQVAVAVLLHCTVDSPRVVPAGRRICADIFALAGLRTLQRTWAGTLWLETGNAVWKFLPSFYMRAHGLGVDEIGLWLGLCTGLELTPRRLAPCAMA